MDLACVFKFTAKPTVIKKSISVSKKNRMLEQVQLMEKEMSDMELQLRSLLVQPTQGLPLSDSSNDSGIGIEEIHHSDSDNYSSRHNSIDSNASNNQSIISMATTHNGCNIGSSGSSSSQYSPLMAEALKVYECQCTDPSRCHHYHSSNSSAKHKKKEKQSSNDWQLAVSYKKNVGTTFQTSIKTISDIATFLEESMHYFTVPPPRSPNYHADRSSQSLIVTNKMLKAEYVLHSFFQSKKKQVKMITIHPSDDNIYTRTAIKLQLVKIYFSCAGLTNPVLVQSYYLPLLESHPDSILASAIAAYVAYSQCKHVSSIPFLTAPKDWAESFRQEAKELLEELLFEQETDVTLAATLMLLAQTALITLDNSEGRLYISLAWRMVIKLKDVYMNTIRTLTSLTPVTEEVALAESWRRTFYSVRYLETYLYMVYDGSIDFASILFDSGVGYPVVLQCEMNQKELREAVSAFHHVVRLNICQMSSKADQTKYQLFSGCLDSVPLSDILHLENQLVHFWAELPPAFRLSDSPMDYLQIDRIQQCENPYALYLNQLYYAYWLTLEARLMQAPSNTNLISATMERLDGDRALLIVSICCDAVAKIFHVLYWRLPCSVELHWLLIASDAMTMLKKAANSSVSSRAHRNLRTTLRVLKNRVQGNKDSNDEYGMFKSIINPNGSVMTSQSTSTSSGSSEVDSIQSDEVEETASLASATTENTASLTAPSYVGELKKSLDSLFLQSNEPSSQA
jgi:hypothetical protein